MHRTRLPRPLDRPLAAAARPRALLLWFAAFGVLLWLISFSPYPFSENGVAATNGGLGTLDLEIGYTPDRGRALLAALGPEGHHRYDLFQLLDVFFPASYAFALGGALYALWARRGLAVLAVLPLVQAAVDYTENVLVRVALSQPADQVGDGLLRTLATLTIAKNVLTYTSMALIGVGLVVLAAARLRGRRAA